MNVVRTAFFDGIRDQALMPLAEVQIPGLTLDAPIASADGLVVAIRRPRPSDWVNGMFVGDHDEPEDDAPHIHGEPA